MEALELARLTIYWVLCAFAVYRVARMLTLEEGPFSLFDRFRDGVEKAAGSDSAATRGANCPYCVGWWLAFPAMLYIWQGSGGVFDWRDYAEAFLLWFSLAGGAAYLQATEGEP